jgi:nicotinate-nucleotide adenylyltransferase
MFTESENSTRLEPWIVRKLRKMQAQSKDGILEIICNGGTFSPPTNGHLLVAQAASEQFNIDATIWIPNGDPPHKKNVLDKEHRIAMVKRATRSNRRFFVSRIEADRPGKSFTNDTLKQLRQDLGPNVRFNLVFGADVVSQLAGWEGDKDYIQQCRLLIAARDTGDSNGGERDELLNIWRQQLKGYTVERIDCPMHSISSTKIRELVAQGLSIEYYVPKAVDNYIRQHGLYKSAVSSLVA